MLLALIAWTAEVGGAQVSAVGAEVLIHTVTTGDQRAPAVSAAADGRFFVSFTSDDVDGSETAVLLRRLTSGGVISGNALQVNVTDDGFQAAARVASEPDGDSVVVWQQQLGETSDTDVYLRRFAADGTPTTTELLVHAASSSNQGAPAVAVDPTDGDIVVVWESASGSDVNVRLRLFSAAGAPLGSETQVNVTSTDLQLSPRVVALPNGQFVVVWQSLGQDGSSWGVYLRRYGANGAALGGEVRVNDTTEGQQLQPSVAAASDGRLIVVWNSFDQDGDRDGVFARIYTASGAAATPEVQVNATSVGRQSQAEAAFLAGGPVVVWRSTEQDGSGSGVYARQLTTDGVAVGDETLLNTTVEGTQSAPSAARTGTNTLAVAWESENVDTEGFGVVARRAQAGTPTAACVSDATTLCLGAGRFRLRAQFRTADGAQGAAQVVPLTADTGYFWFFNAANVEMIVKVIPGCLANGRQWVFAGGLTDVEVGLSVADTTTGATKLYSNSLGTPFAPIQDTSAFGCP